MSQINLRELYADKYQITVDPAAEGKRNIDPMYFIIPCKLGEIYPFGGEYLAVLINRPKTGNKLRNMPELTVHQLAYDAIVFKFHVRDFDKIAKIVGAKRKRQVTSERMKKTGSKTAYRAGIQPENQRSEAR